jgi:hypothetical protein
MFYLKIVFSSCVYELRCILYSGCLHVSCALLHSDMGVLRCAIVPDECPSSYSVHQQVLSSRVLCSAATAVIYLRQGTIVRAKYLARSKRRLRTLARKKMRCF